MRKRTIKKSVKRPPSVRVASAKRKGKRNPEYKLEAKPDSRVRTMSHEFKVPTKTLANLAMRGYVQEQGGGNPNAYTYKLTKLGLAKWRVEAKPKIAAKKATIKAFTAGSATRKFKRTLSGPKNMYEVSVERNPKRGRTNPKGVPPEWVQASSEFQGLKKPIEFDVMNVVLRRSGGSGYDRIYFDDLFGELIEEGYSVAAIKQALVDLSRTGKIALMSFDDPQEERRLKQRYSISQGGRDNQFLRYRRNPVRKRTVKAKTRKRKNSPSDFALAGRISRQIAALEKKSQTATVKAQIKKLQAYLAKVYARAEAQRQAEATAVYEGPRSFSTATKKRAAKKKANPGESFKRLYREAVLSFAIPKNPEPSLTKQVIDYGIRAGATIPSIKRIIARKKGRATANRIVNARVLQLQQSGEYSGMKVLSNPRKRKPTVKAARKNSVKSTIKKVVKSVKKVFKKRNDGSADREDFAGKVSGFKELYFPPGTPQALSTLGPLVHIETDKANIKPAKGIAVLCQDSNHNLYVGSTAPDAAAYTGSESLRNKNLGKVQRIEYRCSKPHLGAEYRGNITWYHDFEAPLPTLRTDADGRFIFSGGNYTVKREGITG